MTCIVGLVHEGRVFIGGDSAGVDVCSYGLNVRSDQKVFRNGPFIMGFTTSFRMGQLLRYKLKAPKRYDGDDVAEFMVTTFVDEVRKALKEGGFAKRENETEEGGTFLVGYEGRLFTIYGDYQVAENVKPFHAVGCGEQLAIGSLYSTGRVMSVMPPRDRVVLALECAEAHSAGVRGPFTILSTAD